MSKADTTLYYIHDPMCSWCWGFRKVRDEVFDAVKDQVKIEYVLGGLAPDSDSIMPMDMQQSIRANWQRIQQEIPGTEFNYDFWTKCQPRRSTYPACRAVIAAGMQQEDIEQKRSGKDMVLAIQQAYYLNAKNPSDLVTLGQLAENMGLDLQQFLTDIQSERCQEKLLQQLAFCRDMGVYSFPSLLIKRPKAEASLLQIDYNDSQKVIDQIILC
jgi:putative protein-disulfide isomerase